MNTNKLKMLPSRISQTFSHLALSKESAHFLSITHSDNLINLLSVIPEKSTTRVAFIDD